MKKFLIFIGSLIVILAVIIQIVLPNILTGMLKEKISKITNAQDVELQIDSSPQFMSALGKIDKIHSQVINGKLGDLQTSILTLDATQLQVDIPTLIMDHKHKSIDDYITTYNQIKMTGTITEDDLKLFLQSRISQLDNLELKITPDSITAISKVTLLGREADIELSGIIIADNGDLYFRMTKLNAKNAILRHIQLDKFVGDVKILSSDKLPLNLKFDNVQLQDGQALVSAVRQ